MTFRPKSMVLSLAVMLTLSACGSGDSSDDNSDAADKDAVTSVAQAYVDAVNAGDVDAACAYQPDLPPDFCVRVTREQLKNGGVLGEDFTKVTKVSLVEENNACAFFDSSSGFIALSRDGDTWKIGAPTSGTLGC